MLTHDGAVLGMTDARLAKVFLGDVKGLLPEEHGNKGQFDVSLRCVMKKLT